MIWIALTFGIISSLHCLVMCGPLQAVVAGQWFSSAGRQKWLWYHSGRIFGYMLLGVVASLIGASIGLQHWQQEFSIAAGLLLLFGYLALRFIKADASLNKLLFPFINRLKNRFSKRSVPVFMLVSGGLNALLPCGMVYGALLLAAGSTNPLTGGWIMLLFGLGTLPLLLALNLSGSTLFYRYPKVVSKLIPISIVVISAWLMVRGMNLDIPYISPGLQTEMVGGEGCM